MELLLRFTPVLAAFAMVLAAQLRDRRIRGAIAVLGALALLLPASLGLTFRAAGTEYLTLGAFSGFIFLGSVIAIAAASLALRNGGARLTAFLLVPPTIVYLWWLLCPRVLGGSVDASILAADAQGQFGIAALAIPRHCVLIWQQIEPRAIPIFLAIGSTVFAAAALVLPFSAIATIRCYARGSRVFLHALGVSRLLTTLLIAITAGSLLQGIDEQLKSSGMYPGTRTWSDAQEDSFLAVAKAIGFFAMGLTALVHGLGDLILSATRIHPTFSYYLRKDPAPTLLRQTKQDERISIHRFDASTRSWIPDSALARRMRNGLQYKPTFRYITQADVHRAMTEKDFAIGELWPDPSPEQRLTAAHSRPKCAPVHRGWTILVQIARAAALAFLGFIAVFALAILVVQALG